MSSQLLFEDLTEPHLAITDAARLLGVSTATIRNWVKTGYLSQARSGLISRESFEFFINEVAGQEKLTTRANKSLKDSHDHEELQDRFQELVRETEIDCDKIGNQYGEALSNAYRNKEGIYYTPQVIAERFFQYLPANRSDLSFCDPCCGSGNFILAAIEHGIDPRKIYGYDTDPVAVEITKRRIFEKTGYDSQKIECIDFLENSLLNNQTFFDVIFTNPPWGKKMNKQEKEDYAQIFCAGKSVDTSSLFFFVCLARLNKDGYLGFLLPDAFFNVAAFEDARKKSLSLEIKAFMDFGKPFKGLLTKAKGIIVKNCESSGATQVQCEGLSQCFIRTQESFEKNPKSIFNFICSSEEATAIEHLYALEHLKLTDKATYGLGIVTGNNKKYCISHPQTGYIPVYKGSDVQRERLNEPSIYIPEDLSLYQQVAPIELFRAKEKLIYRFISSELIFYHDPDQTFFLNSVNMLVLDDDFPINSKQLAQILNSKVMNWLFQAIFETHKVLRSDIEVLPIHTQYFDQHSNFDEESFLNFLGLEQRDDGTFRVRQ